MGGIILISDVWQHLYLISIAFPMVIDNVLGKIGDYLSEFSHISADIFLKVCNQEVGNPLPVLRLTIHKVGNRSPNDCVGDSRQIFVSTRQSKS
jgi:hypothetical protein